MATCLRTMLKNHLQQSLPKHHDWYEKEHLATGIENLAFYSSFDLRDADYKIAPVDANLYPAGFNNICPEDMLQGIELVKQTVKLVTKKHSTEQIKKILIISEAHTKNTFYLENLYELRELVYRSGYQVEIGWPEQLEGPSLNLQTAGGNNLEVYNITREGTRVSISKFSPDLIVLNNDLSAGPLEILQNISQPIVPAATMGWYRRKKHHFFEHYNAVVNEFSDNMGIDPWPLLVASQNMDGVDFENNDSMKELSQRAEAMLAKLKEEYKKRNIPTEPFLFIKNNAGTYGMGVMRIQTASELLALNRREKNKMSTGKGNQTISDVILQEGIPTRFKIEGAYAEPVIYMIGSDLMGGFLRKNATRGLDENLNSKGMEFQRLCISDLKSLTDPNSEADRDLELELVYGTIAQISSVALSRELRDRA